jgi:alkanesulfonate monooxygenase SsuD/methylene tetrahydromethanopterin reductase-like flavin-dependent oxidoreductase (luciferase family)
MTPRRTAFAVMLAVGLLPAAARADDDEKAVKAAFADFQAALKAGDPDKLWPLLCQASQDDADAAAKKLKEDYGKAGAKDKARLEKAYGLTADEIASVSGKTYLKSKRYLGKYEEVPDGKVEKTAIDGDKAVVGYLEPDGDHEKMSLAKESGKWKVVAPPQ